MRAWIEKQRYLMDFTLSSLLRRKVKNLSLLLLYTLMVFMLASAMFFTDSIKKEASVVLRGSPEIIVQKVRAGRHELFPILQIDRLKAIRGVASVEGRLWEDLLRSRCWRQLHISRANGRQRIRHLA